MKRVKMLFAFVVLFACMASAAAWTGATSEPENMKKIDGKPFYVITNADELAWFAAKVNAGETAINGVLANDIVFGKDTSSSSSVVWTTIKTFDGILDGNDFTIYGIYLKANYFIDKLTFDGTLKRINLKKFNISYTETFTETGKNTGAWRARTFQKGSGFIFENHGSISYVVNYNNFNDLDCGGISTKNYGVISHSLNYGNIQRVYNKTQYYNLSGTNPALVTDIGSGYGGGIVGINAGEIILCNNFGKVSINENAGRQIGNGGIVGKNEKGGIVSRSSNYSENELIQQNEGLLLYCMQKTSADIVASNSGSIKTYHPIKHYYYINNSKIESTAEKMQTDQFAWVLNTENGTEENIGIWSRGTEGYPTWANEDSLAIRKVVFDDDGITSNRYTNYKGLVTFPEDPEPAEGYIFSGWYNADEIKVKPTTVFTADQTVKAFYTDASDVFWTINFYNAAPADTILETKSYQHGSIVAYGGAEPTLAATAKYTYTFKGWDVEPTNAVEDFDYHAVYDSTIRSYIVVFNNSDGSKIESATFEYGKMPSCSKIPTRAATAEWKYSHKGWRPALDYVTGEDAYTAIYDSVKVEYKVTFMNGVDVIDEQMVPYGNAAVAPANVTREGYKFVGWNASFAKVTDNLTVKALFEEILESSSSVVKSSSSSAVVSSSSVIKSSSSSKPASSSSAKSSSSSKVSSSSVSKKSSSSKAKSSSSSVKSSSSKKSNALVVTVVPKFSVVVLGRNVQIANAKVGAAFALFDMQGKVLMQSQVLSTNFNIAVPRSGNYLLRIGDRTQRLTVK